ncbi:uncharacterized protein LOC141673733 [Apium graveolens]|uniref:uncharacterized protein LOC141673733 n=1 Tax=Apium graveolens TaxID=4045 RepID=UPI003D7B3357
MKRNLAITVVGRCSFLLILFVILMALGSSSSWNGGSRGGRGGRGRGGRGRGGGGQGRGGQGRGGKGRGTGRGNGSGTENEGDREEGGDNDDNDEENGDEGQESRIVPHITFQRAKRSCCVGDYNKRPATDADRQIVHFIEGRNIKEAKKKKTLSYIIKVNWDEYTHQSKGAEREAFYDRCIKEFKKYYAYPEGGEEEGDRAVKEYLKKNWKSLPYQEKTRAERDANDARNGGSTTATRRSFRPHYFSPRTWDSLNEYWDSDLFKKRSIKSKNARAQLEHQHYSGAMPFDERRERLEEEKQAPISDMEFMDHVYHFDNPATIKLKEDMERVRASQSIPEEMTLDPPPSPASLKKIHRKNELSLTILARPPKKGISVLHPRHPVAEIIGGYKAAELTSFQSTQNSRSSSQPISDDNLDLIVRVSGEIHLMVHSLEMTEVPRALLNDRMQSLATAAFPNRDDPKQQELWTEYMRLGTAFVVDAMALNKKVILEGTRIEKAPLYDNHFQDNDEDDEDQDAENYSLH